MSPTTNEDKPETATSSTPSPANKPQWRGVALSVLVAILAVATGLLWRHSQLLPAFIEKWSTGSSKSETTTTTTLWTITPNSTGLLVDASIYETYLGSELSMLEESPPTNNNGKHSCVYLFLELTPKTTNADMHREWKTNKRSSCRVMVMANTDQFTIETLDLPNLELILCKTRQCVSWIQQKQQEQNKKIPMFYTGFTSIVPSSASLQDDDNLERFHKFIHVAGRSPHKGTWSILQAWLQHPHWPTLTLTSYNNQMVDHLLAQLKQQLRIQHLPSNIRHLTQKLSRAEMDHLMTSHGVHLCLSGMEGFGHYINEARAVGALLLATNYPAMNEFVTAKNTGILLEPSNMLEWTNGLPFANVGAPELARVMNQIVLPMSLEQRRDYGQRAQEAFYTDRKLFQQRMTHLQCYVESCRHDDSTKKDASSCAHTCGLQLE
ncbi:Glycosyl transferases group 1 [Seminavis robusta]|uniref:Glycosyl transferases group 1 n=1 Tax=Seminavis robusta TaxID=568900 RepID=A0A9N8DZE4_9STRA|nr:Glycosyl transferases group 1 [Seminavis robusta]|eukprot:Sro499_g155080.1 Glycosyl transferases group 1 (436) ;mRNA; r:32848-34155